jgi:hypothetical protein
MMKSDNRHVTREIVEIVDDDGNEKVDDKELRGDNEGAEVYLGEGGTAVSVRGTR